MSVSMTRMILIWLNWLTFCLINRPIPALMVSDSGPFSPINWIDWASTLYRQVSSPIGVFGRLVTITLLVIILCQKNCAIFRTRYILLDSAHSSRASRNMTTSPASDLSQLYTSISVSALPIMNDAAAVRHFFEGGKQASAPYCSQKLISLQELNMPRKSSRVSQKIGQAYCRFACIQIGSVSSVSSSRRKAGGVGHKQRGSCSCFRHCRL